MYITAKTERITIRPETLDLREIIFGTRYGPKG